MKIVVGFSGGVDSTLAAKLLLDQGFEVVGAYLSIGLNGAADAENSAGELGIPLIVKDIKNALEDNVCTPFVNAYLAGKTPNPCVLCNPRVKFPSLLKIAEEEGASLIATGHYARVVRRDEKYHLLSAKSSNDQSYMLCGLDQSILSRLVLPLGELEKSEVRRLAEEHGLSAAAKPDSMEICFIPDGNYENYIEKRHGASGEGDFIDNEGNVIGRHLGITHYTVGQRRGLGISAGQRLYVSAIDAGKNTVTLVPEADFYTDKFVARSPFWTADAPRIPLDCAVKVRHSRVSYPARVFADESGFLVYLNQKIKKPSPGQFAVFYNNDELLGGAEIM